jgi:hypothetical protein
LVFNKPFPHAAEVARKATRSINQFINSYGEEGNCEEGPGYYGNAGASLLDFIEELSQVTDLSYLFQESKIRNIAGYIYKVHIGEDYFVNFADADRHTSSPGLVLGRMGKLLGDDTLLGFAAYMAEHGYAYEGTSSGNPSHVYRIIADSFTRKDQQTPFYKPLEQSWLSDIQVATMRDGLGVNGMEGLFLGAKGGHNAEIHGHNDIGNFILYNGTVPVIIDAGRETYSRATFTEERLNLWFVSSAYHNVPLINGVQQGGGKDYAAVDVFYSHEGDKTVFALDISGAYPPDAGIQQYRREFVLNKGGGLAMTDSYSFKEAGGSLEESLLCFEKPEIQANGLIFLGGGIYLKFDGTLFTPAVETVELKDQQMRENWGKDTLFRLRLVGKVPGTSGSAQFSFYIQ